MLSLIVLIVSSFYLSTNAQYQYQNPYQQQQVYQNPYLAVAQQQLNQYPALAAAQQQLNQYPYLAQQQQYQVPQHSYGYNYGPAPGMNFPYYSGKSRLQISFSLTNQQSIMNLAEYLLCSILTTGYGVPAPQAVPAIPVRESVVEALIPTGTNSDVGVVPNIPGGVGEVDNPIPQVGGHYEFYGYGRVS